MILANRDGIAISHVQHSFSSVTLLACCDECKTELETDHENFWFCPLCRMYFGKFSVSNSYFLLFKDMTRTRKNGANLWASTWLGQDVEVNVDW